MTAPGSERRLVRYYCTAGNGMERFLTDEVKKKLAAEHVCHMPGKVLFSSSLGMDRVVELKAAERLFLLLKKDSPLQLSAHTSPAKAASVLQSKLLGDRNQWASAVMTWSRLQGELAGRRMTTLDATSATLEVTRKKEEEERRSEEQQEEEEKCDVESRKSAGEQREEERGNGRLRSGGQSAVHALEKKRKRDDDEEEEEEIRQEPPSVPISFRISCKCTGSLSRYFSTQEVSKIIGVGLSRLLGWKVDLKNPQLEVNVYLSDDHCLLGFPLTRLPLANRSYIKTTGLRATVAWAMASLAQIQPGFCVVDPMCGVGTILIEAAQEHKAARFLGMDIDDGQLQRANENVEFAKLGNRIHLLKSSSTALPLPSTTVDAVVCDLPFGRKFGTKANVAASLPLILAEMERFVRLRVCLHCFL
ncbi:THUMP domain-containing protein 2 [Collichthys lucidus]|uniref:THUMP domain-containing protein 2 n=1 Tax=Collichthys lucidus TaxID=240159 RepID=A0A4U5VD84_COLLU|nr:THUMP domain-containing protein 2 [Collichthys lucidus]